MFPCLRSIKSCCCCGRTTKHDKLYAEDKCADDHLDFSKASSKKVNKQRYYKLPEETQAILEIENNLLNSILDKMKVDFTGTDFMKDAREIYNQEMIKKLGKDGEEIETFQSFGHGIQSYFKMLENFICMFFIFSIIVSPLIYLNLSKDVHGHDILLGLSIGSLGHSEPICLQKYLSISDNIIFECNKGKLSELFAFGLMPNPDDLGNSFEHNYCSDVKLESKT